MIAQRSALLLGGVLAVSMVACSSTRTLQPATLNPLTENWMLLLDPISTSEAELLGMAYSPQDGDRFSGCYTFEPTEIASSFDTIHITKERSGSAASFFRLLAKLGVDADIARIAEAGLRLDSVRIARVRSLAPQPTECAATRPDGMPQFPAITALIGVKQFDFVAKDAQQVNITGDFAQATEEVKVEFDLARSDSAHYAFDDYRWIGARFLGYNLLPVGDEHHFLLPLDQLEILTIPGTDGAASREFEVIVQKTQNGFEIESRKTVRSLGQPFRWTVQERQAFFLDRPPGASAVGNYLVARLESAGEDAVTLRVRTQGFDRITFVGEDARRSLMDWITN